MAICAGLAGFIPASVWAADAGQGEKLAKRWCAACHVVAPDQKQASADVPPFENVAQRKTNEELKNFLIDPHPKMPDMHLSRIEIDNLVAYIRKLDPRGGPPAKKDKDDFAPPKRG